MDWDNHTNNYGTSIGNFDVLNYDHSAPPSLTGPETVAPTFDNSVYDFGYGDPTPVVTSDYDGFLRSIGIKPETTMENWTSPSNEQIESALQGDATFMGLVRQYGSKALDLLKTNGKFDPKKLLALAGGAYAASRPNKIGPTGYQGTIPKYTAEIPMLTAPPAGRRPGSGGINYGGDATFRDPSGKVIGNPAKSINDLRELALMNPQSQYNSAYTPDSVQRMNKDRSAYWDTKPVGSDFEVAGGVLTRTGDNTATFTDAGGKTYQMNRGESFADTAANIPAFAKAWRENYGYQGLGGGIQGLLQSASAPTEIGRREDAFTRLNSELLRGIDSPRGQSAGPSVDSPFTTGLGSSAPNPTVPLNSMNLPVVGPSQSDRDAAFAQQNAEFEARKARRAAMRADMAARGEDARVAVTSPENFVLSGGVRGPGLAKGGLARDGFVLPADVVSHYGNGSSEAGLKLLAERIGATPIKGDGDGMSDSIKTKIDGVQEARVANDEAYVSPEMVAKLGNGSPEKGARKLYAMMDQVRKARTGTTKQGKEIDPNKYMPGGSVQRYQTGGTTASRAPTGATGSESSLSNWAGDYVTDMMGRGRALAQAPYQAYTGPLTAGTSTLQQKAFDMALGKSPSGISNALTGLASYSPSGGGGASATNVKSSYVAPEAYKPGEFSTGIFGTEQAQQYMNPYLKSALDPQMEEARRQADIMRMADAGRLTKAGAFGGSRQAIMESEGRRNLMDKQNQLLSSGYSTAYDKAMQQFNADQQRALDVQKAREQAGQFGYGQTSEQAKTAAMLGLQADTANQSAGLTAAQINSAAATAADANRLQALLGMGNLGINQLTQLSTLGGMQRGIESEGIAADRAQFEEARLNPYKMIQFEQSLLSGMPLQSQSYNMPGTSNLQQFGQGATTVQQLMDILSGKRTAATK